VPSKFWLEARRLKEAVDAILPPELTPEERKAEREKFVGTWVSGIVEEAHEARDRRLRGEPEPLTLETMSGLQIQGAACSWRGNPPPPEIIKALRGYTHAEPDSLIGPELTERFNAATKEVLKMSIDRFNAELEGRA
jgi:hypothetical protein